MDATKDCSEATRASNTEGSEAMNWARAIGRRALLGCALCAVMAMVGGCGGKPIPGRGSGSQPPQPPAAEGLAPESASRGQYLPPPTVDTRRSGASPGQINLFWRPGGGGLRYVVLRTIGSAVSRIGPLDDTSYVDSDLRPGATAQYSVLAVNARGDSSGPASWPPYTAPVGPPPRTPRTPLVIAPDALSSTTPNDAGHVSRADAILTNCPGALRDRVRQLIQGAHLLYSMDDFGGQTTRIAPAELTGNHSMAIVRKLAISDTTALIVFCRIAPVAGDPRNGNPQVSLFRLVCPGATGNDVDTGIDVICDGGVSLVEYNNEPLFQFDCNALNNEPRTIPLAQIAQPNSAGDAIVAIVVRFDRAMEAVKIYVVGAEGEYEYPGGGTGYSYAAFETASGHHRLGGRASCSYEPGHAFVGLGGLWRGPFPPNTSRRYRVVMF